MQSFFAGGERPQLLAPMATFACALITVTPCAHSPAACFRPQFTKSAIQGKNVKIKLLRLDQVCWKSA